MPLFGQYPPSRLWAIQLAEELSRRVYRIVSSWPAEQQKHLGDQLIRAADSAFSNLIEGYARVHPKDRLRFYDFAAASVEEVLGWIHRGRERALISSNEAGVLCGMYIRLSKAIGNLTKSVNDKGGTSR